MSNNHPYVVQIRYKDSRPYHIFCENDVYAKNLTRQFEDEINRGMRIFQYYDIDPIAYPPQHAILVSLENVLEIRIIAKSETMTDTAWLSWSSTYNEPA